MISFEYVNKLVVCDNGPLPLVSKHHGYDKAKVFMCYELCFIVGLESN